MIYVGSNLIKSFQLGTDRYFLSGRLQFLGLADNFFLTSNVFQTIFLITFCEKQLFTTIFKKCHRLFLSIHMKSLI